MAVDRTWYTTLVDDSGSGLDGTLVNKAFIDSLLDAVDTMEDTPWTQIAYNGANFVNHTGTGGWVVDSGDLITLAWRRRGRTMTVAVVISASSVAAPLGIVLYINVGAIGAAIPTRIVTAPLARFVNGGTDEPGYLRVDPGFPYLQVYKANNASFALSTNTTHIWGTITYEVDP